MPDNATPNIVPRGQPSRRGAAYARDVLYAARAGAVVPVLCASRRSQLKGRPATASVCDKSMEGLRAGINTAEKKKMQRETQGSERKRLVDLVYLTAMVAWIG